jgi:orotidine-5'-phosphate decarboxylase
MGGARFADKLAAAVARNDSLVCVGLDPDTAQVPEAVRARSDWLTFFAAGIVEATADLVCCYKPNLAFYEALGDAGLAGLRATLRAMPDDVPVLLDAKRGDVGVSARAYAAALFDDLGADAVTASPYLGFDTLEPFLAYHDRGVFILCKTSNPGSAEFQDLLVQADGISRPLYEHVARAAARANQHGNVGLVVGATHPEAFRNVRAAAPDLPFLVPGVGAQGGDLAMAVGEGQDRHGAGVLIASSRAVLYASRGADWQDAARAAARELRQAINGLRRARVD